MVKRVAGAGNLALTHAISGPGLVNGDTLAGALAGTMIERTQERFGLFVHMVNV